MNIPMERPIALHGAGGLIVSMGGASFIYSSEPRGTYLGLMNAGGAGGLAVGVTLILHALYGGKARMGRPTGGYSFTSRSLPISTS